MVRRVDEAVAARAWIGLGANLGQPRAALDAAQLAIRGLRHSRMAAASSLYRTAPVDAGGPDYLNAVIGIDTRLSPHALLAALQAIEHRLGRERPYRNAPRTLDLDVLLYGDETLHDAALTIPHPRLHQRAFVLQPLAEVAPGLVIAGLGPIVALLAAVADQRIEHLPS